MNSWIILLFLLFANQNGCGSCGDSGCGCDKPEPPCCPGNRSRDRDCDRDCDCDRNRNRDRDCDCDRDRDCDRGRDRDCDCGRERNNDRDSCGCNNESRFEQRFDARPFNNSGCGCDDK